MGGKWLVHGKPIEARDIEEIVGTRFRNLRKFVNLCNSVAWAQAGQGTTSVPSYTERYEIAEGGIDAEWTVFEVDGSKESNSCLVSEGWNVFQYKQKDILANGANKCFSSLKKDVSRSIQKIRLRTGKRPRGFVLFTNLDLTHDTQANDSKGRKLQARKKELREAILKDYDQPETVEVEIVGAAELAAMLNSLPTLRSAYFCRSDFLTLEVALREHFDFAHWKPVQLIGRDSVLRTLQWALEDPRARVIVVSGAPLIGKTRLVLEATERQSMDVVVARNLSPAPAELDDLLVDHHLTIVFAPCYAPERLDRTIKHALTKKKLKLIVEVSFPDRLSLPWFGQDDRVIDLPVRPLSDADSTTLLKAANAKFKSGVEAWVLNQVGGNPGLLLLAAHKANELDTNAASFTKSIAVSMVSDIRRDLGVDLLEVIKFLSLFDPIPLDEIAEQPIRTLGRALDVSDRNLRSIRADEEVLRKKGFLGGGDRFGTVEPPLLANELAAEILEGYIESFFEAFLELPTRIQISIIRRVRHLDRRKTPGFWDRIFGPTGLFFGVDLSSDQLELLRECAAYVPVDVTEKILSELENFSPQKRRDDMKGKRLQLLWLLENLLARDETAVTALKCLLLLAEVDDTAENQHPNARVDFKQAFHPLHQQVAVSLEARQALLQEMLEPSSPRSLRILAVEAIRTALRHSIVHGLWAIPSNVPTRSKDFVGYPRAFSYQDYLYDLLVETTQSQDPTVCQLSCKAIPQAIAETAFAGRVLKAIERFVDALDRTLSGDLAIPPGELGGDLELVRSHLREQKAGAEIGWDDTLQQWIATMDELILRLDKVNDFGVRLKRWAGPWTSADRDIDSGEKGTLQPRCHLELAELAAQACDNPKLLTEDLLKWLLSEEAAKTGIFFWSLGRADAEKKWLRTIERIGEAEAGTNAFSSYFGGLGQADVAFAAGRIDNLSSEKRVHPKARIRAAIYLGPEAGGIDRLEELLSDPEIEPIFRDDPMCLLPWTNELSVEDLLRILRIVVGPRLSAPGAGLRYISAWLDSKPTMSMPLLDIAEHCLLSAEINRGFDYAADNVASKLAELDLERGFLLLEKILERSHEEGFSWNPIDRHSQRGFWSTLLKADRMRALEMLLGASEREPEIAWHAREILDQVNDRAILVSIAAKSEDKATTICTCVTAARPGFWPLAIEILSLYPVSSGIRAILSMESIFRRQSMSGSEAEYFEAKRIEVETLLGDEATPEEARPWLNELVSLLREKTKAARVMEADRDRRL